MIRIIAIFFCTVLALNLYINRAETYIPLATSAPTGTTFDATVRGWAQELSASLPDVRVSKTMAGNCLPVAVALQEKIVNAGHIAIIVAVMPNRPPSNVGHAMVIYNSEMYGDVDSVIDNGFATGFVKHTPTQLYDGTFGMYRGICSNPRPETGTCSVPGI